MKDFAIILSGSPNESWFAGSTVSGTVFCQSDEPKKYNKIVLVFEGRANVVWAGTRALNDIDSAFNRKSSHRVYISASVILWNKSSGTVEQGGLLPAGTNNFPFSFLIPNVPPSYVGKFGSISYSLEAKIIKNSKMKRDTVTTIPVKVDNVVSIDHNPDHMQPLSMEVEKTVCCFCCLSGPIVMMTRLPRTAYLVVNDPIPLEVEINNNSFRQVSRISVCIEKREIFTSEGGDHRFYTETFNTVASGPIRSRASTIFRPEPILLNRDVTTNLTNCDIISVQYFLHITAVLAFGFDLEMEIPLKFGNTRNNPPPIASVPPPIAASGHGPYNALHHTQSFQPQEYNRPPSQPEYNPPSSGHGPYNTLPHQTQSFQPPHSPQEYNPQYNPPPSQPEYNPPPIAASGHGPYNTLPHQTQSFQPPPSPQEYNPQYNPPPSQPEYNPSPPPQPEYNPSFSVTNPIHRDSLMPTAPDDW